MKVVTDRYTTVQPFDLPICQSVNQILLQPIEQPSI